MIRLLLFVGVPLAELWILAELEDRVGLALTLGLVVLTGVVGASLVKRQGRSVWMAIRHRLTLGQIPDVELAHGAMLLVGGALLLTPGILTDVVGLGLLVPWIRELVRVRFLQTIRVVVR